MKAYNIHQQPYNPYTALAIGIFIQAIRDAKAGRVKAIKWLREDETVDFVQELNISPEAYKDAIKRL